MRTQLQRRAVARARTVLSGLVVAGLAGIALVGAGAPAASAAAPAQTTFVNEGFTGASAGDAYILPATTAASGNVACLTAAPTTSAPNDGSIPTCAGATDAVGSGALRLTDRVNNQSGGVGSKQSVPITKGIDAVFNSYQYNGTAADGIVFYLAATDPYNPTVPEKIGYLGGSLGYSASTANNAQGLSHAYLGIGLDRFGNFANRQFGGTGCDADQGTNGTLFADAVTVRGPGNGSVGYCVQSKTTVTGSLAKTGVTDRSQAVVPVEIVINPTTSELTAQQNTSVRVPAGRYAVVFTSIGGTQQVVTGTLPNLLTKNDAGIDPSWIDPDTGYPYKLTYGWVAGTGGQNDVHEVNYLRTTTAAGPVPVLTAEAGGSTSVAHAARGTYTVTPAVSADGGSETELVRTTTTFPAGLTPDLTGTLGDGWSCTAAGQVVTCDQVAGDHAPGDSLPTLSLAYAVTGAARTTTISTVVASTDAEAVTVSRELRVLPQSTTVSTGDVTTTVGSTATLVAEVASGEESGPTTPTGTVTFADAGTGETICTTTLRDGVASCDVPTSDVGATGFAVSYSGDEDHIAVTGDDRARAVLTVTKVPTAITVTAAPADAAYGDPVTLSVTGPEQSDGVAAPTGTITFREGATVLCSVELPDTSCVTTALRAGPHTVTAGYSGDERYAASTSVSVDLTIRRASTTIGTGTPGPGTGDPDDGGDPDTTVTVTHGETTTLDTPNVPEDATGTIDYVTEDGTVLCSATLPETSCAIPDDLPGGTYRVHARYNGDDDHEPAEGTAFDLVVAPQPTVLQGASDATRVTVGTRVRLSVAGLPAGATGTVTFTAADGTVLCTAEVQEDGTASCTSDALPIGSNVVTAAYGGDASFAPTTTTVTVEVTAAVGPTDAPTDEPTTAPSADPTAAPTTGPTATADPTTAAGRGGDDGELAFTGTSIAVGTGAALAAALLVAGTVLLLARRRDRVTAE